MFKFVREGETQQFQCPTVSWLLVMDAFLHVHDADVSTLIKVRWCLRVVGAVYHLGGERERERERERREVERRRKLEEEEGEGREKGKVECSSIEHES